MSRLVRYCYGQRFGASQPPELAAGRRFPTQNGWGGGTDVTCVACVWDSRPAAHPDFVSWKRWVRHWTGIPNPTRNSPVLSHPHMGTQARSMVVARAQLRG